MMYKRAHWSDSAVLLYAALYLPRKDWKPRLIVLPLTSLRFHSQRNAEVIAMNSQILRDAEGYLINPDDWNEDIANELAREESIEINERLWSVLKFIRQYYDEHNIAPDVRHLISYMAAENQSGKKEAKKIIFEMFPYGYVKQACKIAGMKKPRAWSTG